MLLDVEKMAGRKATHHVFYVCTHKNGKKLTNPQRLFDACWADSAEAAAIKVTVLAKQVGWKIEVTRVTVAA